jgi:predicted transcriptional regulator
MFKKCLKPMTWLEERVYLLLKYHEIGKPGQIDLVDLCKSYHIEVVFADGRSRTYPHPKKPGWHVIQVNNRMREEDQRVRIAHELGHLFLHEGVQTDACHPLINLQEYQVGHFVEHLLMPFYMFEDLDYHMSRYDAPLYLSRLFNVPHEFAKKRFERFLNRLYTEGMAI